MTIKCPTCYFAYNTDDTQYCMVCHSPLNTTISNTSNRSMSTGQPPADRHSASTSYERNSHSDFSVSNTQVTPPSGVSNLPPGSPPGGRSGNFSTPPMYTGSNRLEGRIVSVNNNNEIPPRELYAVLSKIILFLFLFIPYILLFIITGFLSISFAIIRMNPISNMFNPIFWSTSLFELLEVIALRRMRGENTAPIYRGIIEDSQDQTYAFLFRGPFRYGDLVPGHHVSLNGTFNSGTFIISDGIDNTTRSGISARRPPWRIIFWSLIFLIFTAGVILYLNYPDITSYMEPYFG